MIVLDQSELIRAEGRVQFNEIFILQMEEKLSITFSVLHRGKRIAAISRFARKGIS
jgi:hypothetical protein